VFEALSERLEGVFRKLRGKGKLRETDVREALKGVRLALLEADVNYKVVKEFLKTVEERAVGEEVMRSLTPAQQVIKIVRDELIRLMGGEDHRELDVPADPYRPAAGEQLQRLASQIGVPCYLPKEGEAVLETARRAREEASRQSLSPVILDTAGRLHIDEALMEELVRLKEEVGPREVLLVADAMTGQDAVKVAKGFEEALGLTGVILTKLDGDARGGAALSIKAVIGKPIKFAGVGERLDALEPFHPSSIASRILGMGDVLTLIERAQAAVEEEKARRLEEKLRRDEFDLEDFREQLRQLRRMGPLEELLKLIPGVQGLKGLRGLQMDERQLVRMEAIINSMTKEERRRPQIINGSRRLRIARGSGTSVQEVNRLLKQFQMARKMIKGLRRGRGRALMGMLQ